MYGNMDAGPSTSTRRAVHYVNEPSSSEPPQSTDYESTYAGSDTPIVIDNGACWTVRSGRQSSFVLADLHTVGVSWLRAGWATEENPRFLCENLVSRYRDRRAGKPVLLAGFASQLEHNSRISAKSPFEGDTVVNFDAMVRDVGLPDRVERDRLETDLYHVLLPPQEHLLDYSFLKLGITGDASVAHPVAMTETLGNPLYCRGCG